MCVNLLGSGKVAEIVRCLEATQCRGESTKSGT